MRELLAPLQRLGKLMEEQNKKIEEISVLAIDLKKAANTNTEELSNQTVILTEIRDLIKEQVSQNDRMNSRRTPRIRLPRVLSGLGTAFQIVGMAAALVASAGIFSIMPVVNPFQLFTAVGIAATFALLVPSFVKISESLKGKEKGIVGKGKVKGGTTFKDMMKNIGGVALAMVAMSIAVALTSFIFQLVMPVAPAKLFTALVISAIMVPLSMSFGKLIMALKRSKLRMNKKGLETIGMVSLAMAAIAIGVSLVAWIWNTMMPSSFSTLPDYDWILKAGLLITIFAIPFTGLVKILKGMKIKDILMGALAIPLIAVGVLATAWIFSYLPDEFKSPPLDFAVGAALAITIFAIPLALIGLLATSGIGAAGILLGAAGIILIAATMWVVAWIFSTLPDLSAISANFTDAIMYPVHAMIDALVRFKEEIGISEMLPLAGGLFAIAGGWLALTAALAGQSIGGLISGAANKLADFLNIDMGKGIPGLIDTLAEKKNEIIALGAPMKVLGDAFGVISGNSEGVVTAMASVLPFAKMGRPGRLEKSAVAISKIADSYSKIASASNVMNVDAINASSKMFDAIANLAEADSEDAMKVLAEELMKAVESLSEVVSDLEDTVDSQNSGFESVLEGALDKFKEKIMGSKEKADGSKGAFDMSTVVSAIQELESRFDRPIPVEDANAF